MSGSSLQTKVLAIGLRTPGYRHYSDVLQSSPLEETRDEFLQSLAIQAMQRGERRRAPAAVRLALDVAHQASQLTSVQASELAAVFASANGDVDTMHQLYTTVNSDDPSVSPTVFHNSVHNAASGYWSISSQSTEPVTFISADAYSFSAALLESVLLAQIRAKPILMVVSDMASPAALKHLHGVSNSFGLAMVLGNQEGSTNADNNLMSIRVAVVNKACDWPKVNFGQENNSLNDLYQSNSAARALCLLNAFQRQGQCVLNLPLSDMSTLEIRINADVLP